jgi:hypothetical protein
MSADDRLHRGGLMQSFPAKFDAKTEATPIVSAGSAKNEWET